MLFSLFEIARPANHPTGGRLGQAHHPGIRRLTYRLDQAAWTHFSLSLTSPSGLKYITNVVKLGDSSHPNPLFFFPWGEDKLTPILLSVMMPLHHKTA
jgi:hypothetical protein